MKWEYADSFLIKTNSSASKWLALQLSYNWTEFWSQERDIVQLGLYFSRTKMFDFGIPREPDLNFWFFPLKLISHSRSHYLHLHYLSSFMKCRKSFSEIPFWTKSLVPTSLQCLGKKSYFYCLGSIYGFHFDKCCKISKCWWQPRSPWIWMK